MMNKIFGILINLCLIINAFSITSVLAAEGDVPFIDFSNGGTVEFEDFVDEKYVKSGITEGYTDKKAVVLGTGNNDSFTFDISFEVERPGYYDLDVNASIYDTGNSGLSQVTWLSPVSISYGSTVLDVSHKFILKSSAGYKIENSTYAIRVYSSPGAVYLDSGVTNMTVTISKRPGDGGGKWCALDSMTFTPREPISISADGGVLEFEDFAEASAIKKGLNSSLETDESIKGIGFNGLPQSSYALNVVFEAQKEGYYYMDIFGSVNGGTTTWLSPLTMTIGEDTVNVSTASTISSLEPVYYIQTKDFPIKKYSLSDKFYFEEGINKIVFELKGRAVAEKGLAFSLDRIEIRAVKDISGLEFADSDVMLKRNGTHTAVIYNGQGTAIFKSDVESMEFSVSNANIASVDDDGTVTGLNFGRTTLNVKIENEGEEFNLSKTIYVVSDKGILIEAASISGNKVTVRLNAADDYLGGSKLYAVSYSEESGKISSVKSMASLDVEAMANGETRDVEISISGYESGDSVSVFIVDGNNPSEAQWMKVKVIQ